MMIRPASAPGLQLTQIPSPVSPEPVTTKTAPKPKPPPTVADLVSAVRSGVIRVETSGCEGNGVGSGFLVASRLIATVEHVVHGATEIKLVRGGKVVATGTVIGADQARDVALVRTDRAVHGHQFRFQRSSPRIGQDVLVLGFPLGLPLTLTRGSVSGLNRTVPIEGFKRSRLVQTDASVSPGNSGGPLLSSRGNVVGLVDLDATQADGVAFAVSAGIARPLIEAWKASPQPIPIADCPKPAPAETRVHSPPPAGPDEPQLVAYEGQTFAILYPSTWEIVSSERAMSWGGYDTTIQAEGDPSRLMRVDVTLDANSPSPEAAAAPVIKALRPQRGYAELSLEHIDFNGYDALRWEFTVEERGLLLHKIDIFFIDELGNTWALLAQSPDNEWPQAEQSYERLLGTFTLR